MSPKSKSAGPTALQEIRRIADRLDRIEATIATKPTQNGTATLTFVTVTAEQPVCAKPEPLEWHCVSQRLPAFKRIEYNDPERRSHDHASRLVLKHMSGVIGTGSYHPCGRGSPFIQQYARQSDPVVWWAYKNPTEARAHGYA